MTEQQTRKNIPILGSLAVKIPLTFVVVMLVFIATFLSLLEFKGKPLIFELSNQQVQETGESIVSQLGNRIELTESLVTAMANAGEALPPDDDLHHKVIQNIVNYEGTESFIAGGGIWPEPYLYQSTKARRSFFWGRERNNTLKYYDDYNLTEGNGYHNEEWYVPAKLLTQGAVYWSSSYIDPYSFQSMVTATAPMFRSGVFYGVTTIDLKLEGLTELLAAESKKFEGYAYALDRNGTFLSFPHDGLSKRFSKDNQGHITEEYLNINDLANGHDYFKKVSAALKAYDYTDKLKPQSLHLSKKIAQESYQVDETEAIRIVQMIEDPLKSKKAGNTFLSSLMIEDDPLLNQPVIANIFHVPDTYWKIITVTPQSHAYASSEQIIQSVLSTSFIVLAISLLSGLFIIRKILITPLVCMTKQVKNLDIGNTSTNTDQNAIQGIRGGELGELAFQFNSRARQLLESNTKLEEQIGLAKQAAETKSQFLANMSHEIRTPINGVLGMITLMRHTQLDKQQTHYANMARSSAESLLSVINDILDFSKIEAGKLDIEALDFDVRSQLNDFAGNMAHLAQKKGLELILDIHQVPHQIVKGDPGRIRQILINLVSNAIKFTDMGEVVIRLRLEQAGKFGLILYGSVSDTGIGIPKSKQQTLFQSFSQVDESNTRKYGGTGLGLAISKQLCELMGGGISLHSEPNKGSQFNFSVMLQTSDQVIKDLPKVDLNGIAVLIVDDNKTNREVLRGQLEHWGAIVTEADGGHQALKILEHEETCSFKVAILDMQMPFMNGAELGSAIRDNHKYDDLHLMMMTSIGERGDANYFARLGFSAYFPKPTSTSDLYDALSVFVDGGEALTSAEPLITHHHIRSLKRSPSQKKVKLLLAEDNAINQQVALGILESLGYTADVAGNGEEAIDMLKANNYQIILMDCQMPIMDGYETTRSIRNKEANVPDPNVTIIAMTANAMKGDMERCIQAGMDDYMSKPIDPATLEEKLAKWIK